MKLAVLGSPISYSLSPKLHSAAYRKLGIAAEYSRFEVGKEDLDNFLSRHGANQWRGFSLTMPLKDRGKELVTDLDEAATNANSVNTLLSNGRTYQGLNTDVSGFEYLFLKLKRLPFSQGLFESVAILGSGGTARAAALALRDFATSTTVFRRSDQKDILLNQANASLRFESWKEVGRAADASLVINAVTAEGASDAADQIKSVPFVIDAIYSPWPPAFLRHQDEDRYFSGKDLLVAQALRQIALFADVEFAQDEMFQYLRGLI